MDEGERIGNLLGALALAVDETVRAAATEAAGHGGAAAAAITTLAQYPGESLERLHRTLGVTPSAIVRLADRLQADGLIERRRRDGDGRAIELHPTDAGQQRAAAILTARQQALARVLAPLTEADRTAVAAILERLLTGLTTTSDVGDQTCRLCNLRACPQSRCPVSQEQTRLGAPPTDPSPV